MQKFKLKTLFLFGFITLTLASCETDIVNTTENNTLEESFNLRSNSSIIPDSYIVTFHKGTIEKPGKANTLQAYERGTNNVKAQIASKFKLVGVTAGNIENAFGYALEGFAGKLNAQQLELLEKDPRVKRIERDYTIRLAPGLSAQAPPPGKGPSKGGNPPPAQETPWGIPRVGGAVDGTGLTAWIIDSGVDSDHPDLNVDVARSRSYVTKGKYSIEDGNGHGTHVAGTVAAKDNNEGVIGVAPNATIVALRVLDNRGSGSFSWTVAALDYVASAASAGDAVNMSLGPQSRYIDSAIDDATMNVASLGIKIAIAAGNSSDDASFYSPARNNHANIYTISAMDINDNWASFSNYGSPVDYAAPGVGVKSCYKSGEYATLSGTSMASPHVCGLLLLGNITTDGFVNNDPDGNADPIAQN